MKVCTGCKEAKEYSKFYKQSKSNDGYGWACKDCHREYAKKRRQEPEFRRKKRENSFRFSYGITVDEYEQMYERQGGLCAICNQPETKLHSRTKQVMPLAVDHCYSTSAVRGLLCSRCNLMIGMSGDDADILQQAALYLSGGVE